MKARNSLLYKIAWGFMVAVFFFAATPHDFIHDEIVSHRDTVDGYHKHAGVSKAHVHCEFLQSSLSPSLPAQPPLFHFQVSLYCPILPESVLSASRPAIRHTSLRGPPAFC